MSDTQLDTAEDLSEPTPMSDPMGMDMAPAGKATHFWPAVRRLLGLLAPHKALMSVVMGLVILSVIMTVLAPRVIGWAMDVIFNGVIGASIPSGQSAEQTANQIRAGGNNELADMISSLDVVPGQGIDFVRLSQLIFIVLGMYLLASAFMWAQGYILNRLVMRVVYNLRSDVEQKIHRLPLRYIDSRRRGDLLSRVTNDVDNIQTALQQALSQLIESALKIIGIAAMMFIVSWQLALVALLALPLSGIVAGVIGVRAQKLFAAQWKQTGVVNGHVEESFTGHELVTAFGRERDMVTAFDERNGELYRASFGAQFMSGIIMPAMQFISYLTYVGIAVLGGLRVATGNMTLGDATAFIQYSREFTEPMGQIAGIANMLQSGVASAERTFEVLDAEEEDETEVVSEFPTVVRGDVVFDDVSFSYDAAEPLIEHLSFAARAGQTVAIVGPTGAGKTTLVNLVMRFYEIDSGRIIIDGVNTAEVSREAVRSQTGMVLQDTWLFNGTIRENIRYGRQDATDDEVVEAATATYVDRFVRQLPDGYDTVIDDDGGSVSAGEKQLITIARAFLAKPSILILDEATSSVDTRTELLVQQAMAALRSNRTSFVIAHRLSTIRDADTILVMQSGRIVEQGTHVQLLKQRGPYFDLYESQFAAAAVDGDGDV